MFVCKDGSIKQSHKTIDVLDLEAYRKSIMGDKYAKINFVYSEIDDNRDRTDAIFEASEDRSK